MQGRLLPKYRGRYQAFPIGYWEDEFPLAKELGLDLIEFIFDFNQAEANPLLSTEGIQKIKALVKETGVGVDTICADYFMRAPLHSRDISISGMSINILFELIKSASNLGVKDIVIPCVDQSSLKTPSSLGRLVDILEEAAPAIERADINLCLETDLPPEKFLYLLNQFTSSRITVNYDIGNSASLGYDCEEEIKTYGHIITDVHIKDRELSGGPVFLGMGNARIKKVLELLDNMNYTGPLIMQAFRDDDGLELFKKQLNYVKAFLYE